MMFLVCVLCVYFWFKILYFCLNFSYFCRFEFFCWWFGWLFCRRCFRLFLQTLCRHSVQNAELVFKGFFEEYFRFFLCCVDKSTGALDWKQYCFSIFCNAFQKCGPSFVCLCGFCVRLAFPSAWFLVWTRVLNRCNSVVRCCGLWFLFLLVCLLRYFLHFRCDTSLSFISGIKFFIFGIGLLMFIMKFFYQSLLCMLTQFSCGVHLESQLKFVNIKKCVGSSEFVRLLPLVFVVLQFQFVCLEFKSHPSIFVPLDMNILFKFSSNRFACY